MRPKEREFSNEMKDRIRQEQDDRCALCGSRGHLTIHHKIPVSKGGGNNRENGVGLCRHPDGCGCHTVVDFLTIQKRIPYEQIMEQGVDYYIDWYRGKVPGVRRKRNNRRN